MKYVFLSTLFPLFAWAYEPPNPTPFAHQTPDKLEGVGVEEHLGQTVDPSLQFTTESGRTVSLGSLFNENKPVLFTMVYYGCTSLCNYHLNGLNEVFKKMKWTAGKEFTFIAVSMDSREGPELAAKKRQNYLKDYGRTEGQEGWHFLVGNEKNVKILAQQLGFKYRWVEEEKQFAHVSTAYILSPKGLISRYLYGIEFDPSTLRYSLLEASNGRLGTVVDQLILYCFHFDPTTNKYSLYAFNIMRVAAALVVLIMGIAIIPFWIKELKNSRLSVKGEY